MELASAAAIKLLALAGLSLAVSCAADRPTSFVTRMDFLGAVYVVALPGDCHCFLLGYKFSYREHWGQAGQHRYPR